MDTSVKGKSEARDTAHDDVRGVDVLLGRKIRDLRQSRGMSLKDVAAVSGFSIGLLSQIERGMSSPSVRVLASLAKVLNVSLGTLFDDVAPDQPDILDGIVVRGGARRKLALWRTGISKELLTPQGAPSRLEMYLVILEPNATTGSDTYFHEGEEAGFVLEGTLELTVDDKTYTLAAGDSFRFSSDRPHRFENLGPRMARVLWAQRYDAVPSGEHD